MKAKMCGGLALLLTAIAAPAQAQAPDDVQMDINLHVLPFAQLIFGPDPNLYLEVPTDGSTSPSDGVNFTVSGNANATLFATPSAFVQVGTQYMGKATLDSPTALPTDIIGYTLTLQFPDAGVDPPGVPTNKQTATLPGNVAASTFPPLTVDLSTTGQERTGVLHMESDLNWTPSGGIPLPGPYAGLVTLTLTASD